jgi:hypothetical protein
MTKTRTIKNIPVWLTTYSTPDTLASDDDKRVVGATSLHFPWREDGTGPEGWTLCGMATVTYEFCSNDELVSNKVANLKAELEKDRAESEVRQNRILEQISKLQALEYTA